MKKVAYCVDSVTIHNYTKFCLHICNIGDFTVGMCHPSRYYKGPKSKELIGLKGRLEVMVGHSGRGFLAENI